MTQETLFSTWWPIFAETFTGAGGCEARLVKSWMLPTAVRKGVDHVAPQAVVYVLERFEPRSTHPRVPVERHVVTIAADHIACTCTVGRRGDLCRHVGPIRSEANRIIADLRSSVGGGGVRR